MKIPAANVCTMSDGHGQIDSYRGGFSAKQMYGPQVISLYLQ